MAVDLGAKLRGHMDRQIEGVVADAVKKMFSSEELKDMVADLASEAVVVVLENADDYRSFMRATKRVVENYIDANIDLEDLVKDALDNYFDKKTFTITPEN